MTDPTSNIKRKPYEPIILNKYNFDNQNLTQLKENKFIFTTPNKTKLTNKSPLKSNQLTTNTPYQSQQSSPSQFFTPTTKSTPTSYSEAIKTLNINKTQNQTQTPNPNSTNNFNNNNINKEYLDKINDNKEFYVDIKIKHNNYLKQFEEIKKTILETKYIKLDEVEAIYRKNKESWTVKIRDKDKARKFANDSSIKNININIRQPKPEPTLITIEVDDILPNQLIYKYFNKFGKIRNGIKKKRHKNTQILDGKRFFHFDLNEGVTIEKVPTRIFTEEGYDIFVYYKGRPNFCRQCETKHAFGNCKIENETEKEFKTAPTVNRETSKKEKQPEVMEIEHEINFTKKTINKEYEPFITKQEKIQTNFKTIQSEQAKTKARDEQEKNRQKKREKQLEKKRREEEEYAIGETEQIAGPPSQALKDLIKNKQDKEDGEIDENENNFPKIGKKNKQFQQEKQR